ncbi:MAG TPA: heme-binding domain-containing protein [Acidimicrobiales bacterium]|nr:heme-binding domain-containing protein [Acidimicrobiales bacterium]
MKWLLRLVVAAVVLFVVIQLVPYGRTHHNPPIVSEPAYTSTRGAQLVRTACYDCHSNQTRYPWYTSVAPISWWSQNHVDEGRQKLNFTDWANSRRPEDLVETVQNGSMPPNYYRLMHADARLSSADKQALIEELRAIAGTGGGTGGERRSGGGDD